MTAIMDRRHFLSASLLMFGGVAAHGATVADVIKLDEVDGADFPQKWKNALDLVEARGEGTISIGSAVIDVPLDIRNRRFRKLAIVGQGLGTRISARQPMDRMVHIRDNIANEIVTSGFDLDGAGMVGNALLESFDTTNCMDMGFDGGGKGAMCFGLHLRGSRSSANACRFRYLRSGLSVTPSGSALQDLKIQRCRFEHLSLRGLQIVGKANLLSRVWVDNCHFGPQQRGCQPVRVDGANGPITQIFLRNGSIIDDGAEHGADDSLSLNGQVSEFVVSGWNIRRTTDVGINASNGVGNGSIADNHVARSDYGIGIGTLKDFPAKINTQISILRNTLTDCPKSYVSLYASRDVSVAGNRGSSSRVVAEAGLDFRQSTKMRAVDNAWSNVARQFVSRDKSAERSDFWEFDGISDDFPKMSVGAPPGKSRMRLGGARRSYVWNGSGFVLPKRKK